MSDSDSKTALKSNLQLPVWSDFFPPKLFVSTDLLCLPQIMAAPMEVDAGKPAANKPADPLQY